MLDQTWSFFFRTLTWIIFCANPIRSSQTTPLNLSFLKDLFIISPLDSCPDRRPFSVKKPFIIHWQPPTLMVPNNVPLRLNMIVSLCPLSHELLATNTTNISGYTGCYHTQAYPRCLLPSAFYAQVPYDLCVHYTSDLDFQDHYGENSNRTHTWSELDARYASLSLLMH